MWSVQAFSQSIPMGRIGATVLLLIAALTSNAAAENPKPNILVISLDTTRSDHLTAYGYTRDTSPFLQELGESGVVFERSYSMTSSTGPTHASVFSGLYPITHGVIQNGALFSIETPTLAERLQQRGYQTGAVISSIVLNGRFGYGAGFEDYLDTIPLDQGIIQTKASIGKGDSVGYDRRANFTTDEAITWLSESRNPDKPFFLFVHYFEPHEPYHPPREYRREFVSSPPKSLERTIELYDASIAFTDAEMRRLFDFMREGGLLDDTLVVVFGDHGEGLMEHGEMTHETDVFEESVRVPLIVTWEGKIPGQRRIEEPVAVIDVYATVLQAGQADSVVGDQPSHNLWPVLSSDEPLRSDRPIFLYRRHHGITGSSRYRGEHFAVVQDEWKFILGPAEELRALYFLRDDPDERINRIVQDSDKADELEAVVMNWLARHMREYPDIPGLSEEDLEALRSLGYTE